MNLHDYLAFDTSCVSTSQPGDNDYHILFSGDMLLLRNSGDTIALPRRSREEGDGGVGGEERRLDLLPRYLKMTRVAKFGSGIFRWNGVICAVMLALLLATVLFAFPADLTADSQQAESGQP